MTSGWQSCCVATGGHQVEYLCTGSGDPMVFLPSMARSARDFLAVGELIAAQGWRAIAVQPRGIGGSTGPLEGMTLFDMAEDVAAVIREVGDTAIVVGHAFGNWVARCLAVRHPEHVRAVVLAAASREGAVGPELRRALAACHDTGLDRAERLRHLQRLFFAPGSDATCWLEGWHAEVAPFQRAAGDRTPRALWRSGGQSVPLLDLQGDCDPTCPAELADQYRNAFGADRVTVAMIAGASHAMFPEHPGEVAAALAAFATKLDASRAS